MAFFFYNASLILGFVLFLIPLCYGDSDYNGDINGVLDWTKRTWMFELDVVPGAQVIAYNRIHKVDPIVNVTSGFGRSLCCIGDVNGDGIVDIAIGAARRDSVFVVLMNRDGSYQKVTRLDKPPPGRVTGNHYYGGSCAGIGDLDGDSIPDLAVGQRLLDDAITVFYLNADGSARESNVVRTNLNNQTFLFGASLTSFDINGDGVNELFVGTPLYNYGTLGNPSVRGNGTVAVLFLDYSPSGLIATQKILPTTNYGNTGYGVCAAGDMDGDGIGDLIVMSRSNSGAVWLYTLNSDGTAKTVTKLWSGEGQYFGPLYTAANLGDLTGNGYPEIIVGTRNWTSLILNLGPSGTVVNAGSFCRTGDQNCDSSTTTLALYHNYTVSELKWAAGIASFIPPHANFDPRQHISDLDGDGRVDFMVGSDSRDEVFILFSDIADTSTITTVNSPTSFDYIGCYIDSAVSVVGSKYKYDAAMTPTMCSSFCENYEFFALQGGFKCFCGNTYDTLGRDTGGGCGVPCGGDSGYMCGGSFRNSMFSNNVISYREEEIGCFSDAVTNPDFPVTPSDIINSPSMTVELCSQNCASASPSYPYFALKSGTNCHCGLWYGAHGSAARNSCDRPCSGESNLFCGGAFTNVVYKTNATYYTPHEILALFGGLSSPSDHLYHYPLTEFIANYTEVQAYTIATNTSGFELKFNFAFYPGQNSNSVRLSIQDEILNMLAYLYPSVDSRYFQTFEWRLPSADQGNFVITALTDVDECASGRHLCQQLCIDGTNPPGSYTCGCNTGYSLVNTTQCVVFVPTAPAAPTPVSPSSPPNPASPSSPSANLVGDGGGGLAAWMYAIIVIGVLLALCVVICICCYYKRKHAENKQTEDFLFI